MAGARRTEVQHDAERAAADLGDDAAIALERGLGVAELLGRLDGGDDVVDCAVEFLFGVCLDLADLPHEDAHDRVTLGFQNLDKLVHRCNSRLFCHLS